MKSLIQILVLVTHINAYALIPATTTQQQHLNDLFTQAQQSYISGSLDLSSDFYKEVYKVSKNKAWPEKEQKIIFQSLIKVGQLEHSDSWYKKAYLFNPKNLPSEKIFPPPLIKHYKKLTQVWKSEGKQVKPDIPPTKNTQAKEVNLQPQSLDFSKANNELALQQLQLDTSYKKTTKWYKNKWLWIAAGVITAGIVVHHQTSKNEPQQSEPTTTPATSYEDF